MKKNKPNKEMLQFKNVICDADDHFEFLDFFLDHVKKLVVIGGVDDFLSHMNMSSPTYYKRLHNRDLWSYGELKKAAQYFKKQGIIL